MKSRKGCIIVYSLTMLSVLICAYYGSSVISVFSEHAPASHTYCIVIDAGHGGVDGGAVSCTGIPESRYNLEIALRLEDLLHLLGHKTKMIRKEDISVYTRGESIAQKKVSDLKERVRITKETPNAILLSIHQNYFSDPRYRGAQVFYPNTPGSAELAVQMQNDIRSFLDTENHRNIKQSKGIYLMEQIQCTGLLIECGFLSNPQEASMLQNSFYQQKLCSVIATSLARYLSNT